MYVIKMAFIIKDKNQIANAENLLKGENIDIIKINLSEDYKEILEILSECKKRERTIKSIKSEVKDDRVNLLEIKFGRLHLGRPGLWKVWLLKNVRIEKRPHIYSIYPEEAFCCVESSHDLFRLYKDWGETAIKDRKYAILNDEDYEKIKDHFIKLFGDSVYRSKREPFL